MGRHPNLIMTGCLTQSPTSRTSANVNTLPKSAIEDRTTISTDTEPVLQYCMAALHGTKSTILDENQLYRKLFYDVAILGSSFFIAGLVYRNSF